MRGGDRMMRDASAVRATESADWDIAGRGLEKPLARGCFTDGGAEVARVGCSVARPTALPIRHRTDLCHRRFHDLWHK